MTTTPPPESPLLHAAEGAITNAELRVDKIVLGATGYKLPWVTPAQVLIIIGPFAYSAGAAIQNLVQHHRFSVTSLWELLASAGTLGAVRLGQYALKVFDPYIHPTEGAPQPAVEVVQKP